MKSILYFLSFASLLFFCVDSSAQYTITGFTVYGDTTYYGSSIDTCDRSYLVVTVSGYTAGLTTRTTYQGGFTTSATVYPSGSIGVSSASIFLNTPGSYSFKIVLYLGAAPIDSTIFGRTKLNCGFSSLGFYNDSNSNCALDGGDLVVLSPAVVEVSTGGVPVDTINAFRTSFRRHGSPGTVYQYRLLEAPEGLSVSCPSSGILYDTVWGLGAERDFAVTCSSAPGFDLKGIVSIRCGPHAAIANVIVSNATCNPQDADVVMKFSPKYNYNGSTAIPVSSAANIASWHFPGMTPLTSRFFQVRLERSGSAYYMYGDTVNSTFEITPTVGDSDPSNNVIVRVDTVKAGFDPNDIAVYPQGYIPAGTELEYSIRFENTGNDRAANISVYDTLSDNIDFNSLKVIAATHRMQVAQYTTNVFPIQNVVKFDFPDIFLPDSSHHGYCDGMVVFKVKTKTGLAPGTLINNRAGIYFDYNPVVMTNTVTNIIPAINAVPEVHNNSAVSVYPNPVHDMLHVNTAGAAYTAITITNTIGQTVASQVLSAASAQIDVQLLPAGIYFLYLKGEAGTMIQRFEKQ